MTLWTKLSNFRRELFRKDETGYERYLLPGLLALVILNVLVVLTTTVSIIALTRARATSRKASATNVVLEQVYTGLREAESGQRGYILTGDPAYLAPYTASSKQVPQLLASLKTQPMDSSQEAELATVIKLSNQKLAELSTTIALRRDQGFDAALAVVNTEVGINYMKQAHATLEKMEQQNSDKSTSRSRVVTDLAWFAIASLAASLLITAGFVYFIKRLFAHTNIRNRLLAKTNNELNRSNRELQDFASVASHDLQEPLRKIQAFGDRLQSSTELSEESELFLDRMLNAAGRMRSLIDDLLAFSRVTSKAKPFERVDLNKVVAAVLSDMEIKIEDTKAKIIVKPLPKLDADAFQMRQVFQNLISNGLKFQAEGVVPKLTISSRLERQYGRQVAVLSVKDNGIGFDTKYLDRIFTIFQRLHGRNDYEGTGIGLAVVRKIAERHGGSVTAESELGHGACFIVTLPTRHKSQGK